MKTERQVTFHLVYLNAITTIKKKKKPPAQKNSAQ